MDEAMENYSKAFSYLLSRACEEIEAIEEKYKGKYKANYIAKWVEGSLDKELNSFGIEPFKDSIKMDFAAVLSGYLNLKTKGKAGNYPSIYMEEQMYKRKRPIFFCRYSTKRNYSLLYNEEKDRYYAKIYLMNVKNEKRKRPMKFQGKALRYIDKNREPFLENGKKRSYVMFPLSFGKWQEKYLKEAIENPEMLKTARLFKRKKDYYLSINIVKDICSNIDAENYMGISRGIDNGVNYTIVDKNGELLCDGFRKIADKNISVNIIHDTSNHLLKIALENKCQVIMEKLIEIGDNLSWEDGTGKTCNPILNCSKYNELFNILNYKLKNNGLPSIVRVSSVAIFNTCPYCGKNSKANRFSREMLMCTSCGTTVEVEKAGPMNLSRRLIKYENHKIKIIVENTDRGLKFTNRELDFEFYPVNPYDCVNEFTEEIEKTIKNFYDNIDIEAKRTSFKKRYNLIKKIEKNKNAFELISIN